jgi:hypothetical protein
MRASALVLAILLSAAPALGQVQKVQGVAGGYPVRVDIVSGGGGGGDATAANQVTEIARLTSILTALGGGLPAALVGGALSVTGPLTDAQLRASAVAVTVSPASSGSVSAVSCSGTAADVLAVNATAKFRVIYNRQGNAIVYFRMGAGAHTGEATASFALQPGQSWEAPSPINYTGLIQCVTGGGLASVQATEG